MGVAAGTVGLVTTIQSMPTGGPSAPIATSFID